MASCYTSYLYTRNENVWVMSNESRVQFVNEGNDSDDETNDGMASCNGQGLAGANRGFRVRKKIK
jgi:hypothetical protein